MEDNGIIGLVGELIGDSSFFLCGFNLLNDGVLCDVVCDFLLNWIYSCNSDGVVFLCCDVVDVEICEFVVNQVVQMICNCIDEFGVVELVIVCQGFGINCIVVQLFGVDDLECVKDMIKSIVFFEFCFVDLNGGFFDLCQVFFGNYGGSLLFDVEIFEEDV